MKLSAGLEDRGQRLDIFLTHHLEGLTRSQAQVLNLAGAVRVNGEREKAGYKIRGGELIEVDPRAPEPTGIEPETISLHIYFEDEDLAVIEKPAGLVMHPGAGNRSGTLVNALLGHFRSLSDAGGDVRPGIVHRLDKWTSGLLIVAKNNVAHARIAQAFHERQVQKTYLALVHGKMRRPSGKIDLSIGRHRTERTRMSTRATRGRLALTEYRVMEQLPGFSLLEVRLHTGRTHQVRVHLSAIGHPVVGDDVYGEKKHAEFVKRHGPLDRYFLHAAKLEFRHPGSGTALTFTSPLPAELAQVIDRLRENASRQTRGQTRPCLA